MESIKVENLTKIFSKSINSTVPFFSKPKFNEENSFKAVNNISFSIEKGESIGFIGPNGAGKTTTLKMLSGILIPNEGTINILGFNPVERNYDFLKRISVVMGNKFQKNLDLPSIDTYDLYRVIYKIDKVLWKNKIDELVSILNLEDKIHTQFKKLSLGQKMKCELILALLHSPEIIFLDEPTIGLDIVTQKNLRDFLKKLNKEEGTTILLTSHYMDDVEELCSRIILINRGEKLFDDSLSEMMRSYSKNKFIKLIPQENTEISVIKNYVLENFQYQSIVSDEVSVTFSVPKEFLSTFVNSLLVKFNLKDIDISETSLEEIVRDMYLQV